MFLVSSLAVIPAGRGRISSKFSRHKSVGALSKKFNRTSSSGRAKVQFNLKAQRKSTKSSRRVTDRARAKGQFNKAANKRSRLRSGSKGIKNRFNKSAKKGFAKARFNKASRKKLANKFNRLKGKGFAKAGFNRAATPPHVYSRMAQRGVNYKMAKTAMRKGSMYYDIRNRSHVHVLKNGFASGKHLLVATDPASGRMKTVIKSSRNLVKKHFIPLR